MCRGVPIRFPVNICVTPVHGVPGHDDWLVQIGPGVLWQAGYAVLLGTVCV